MTTRLETEQQIVERYRHMADASHRMVQAAHRDDWDQVCTVEKECALIVAELSTMGDLAPADPTLRQQKIDLMKRVLSDDAEIRLLSQPWLGKLDALLRSPETAARLGRTYGAGLQQG